MAYLAKNLSVLAYANGFTLWHYTTPDADIDCAGYFNRASVVLRVGDIIMASLNVQGGGSTVMRVVSRVEGETVTIARLSP